LVDNFPSLGTQHAILSNLVQTSVYREPRVSVQFPFEKTGERQTLAPGLPIVVLCHSVSSLPRPVMANGSLRGGDEFEGRRCVHPVTRSIVPPIALDFHFR
jgi:hypothetical protein